MTCELYMLRTVNSDGTSYGGFQWPLEVGAEVVSPDWTPLACCGGGLHGLLMGEGAAGLMDLSADATVLVCAVREDDVVWIGDDKVKVPRCRVVYVGEWNGALDLIGGPLGQDGLPMATLTGGDGSTLTGGDGSTLTGGNRSTLTGGNRSTLTGGYGSTLTGGNRSTLTGGNRSTLTGGYGSTLTGGYGSTLTGGDGSTLTGGEDSTLTGGYGSTLTGGNRSTLMVKWWDGARYRFTIGYVGEDGIHAGVAYGIRNEKLCPKSENQK